MTAPLRGAPEAGLAESERFLALVDRLHAAGPQALYDFLVDLAGIEPEHFADVLDSISELLARHTERGS